MERQRLYKENITKRNSILFKFKQRLFERLKWQALWELLTFYTDSLGLF